MADLESTLSDIDRLFECYVAGEKVRAVRGIFDADDSCLLVLCAGCVGRLPENVCAYHPPADTLRSVACNRCGAFKRSD